MLRFIVHLIANGLTLVILAEIIPGQVSYTGNDTIVFFAVVLALLNALLLPVLRFISIPLTCLTLGLFALVVNAAVFYLGGRLLNDIHITFWGALAGTIVAGILNSVLSELFRGR